MFNHILVPIDGSTTALLAMSKAAELAKAFGSTVTLVYVIDPYPFTGVGAEFAYGPIQYLDTAKAEAAAAVDVARAALQAFGVAARTQVQEGHVVHRGILDAARDLGVDLIVMGSHGRRGIEKLVLGSVTQRVLGHTHLSVLVVRQ